jgi:hypothetical protein
MSLLESNPVKEGDNSKIEKMVSAFKSPEVTVESDFDGKVIKFDEKVIGFPEGGNNGAITNLSGFSFNPNGIQDPKFGGIAFSEAKPDQTYAIKFDSALESDLNKRLEELYKERQLEDYTIPITDNNITFSDSNLAAFSRINTNEKTNSANEKEGYNMANYGFSENNDNSIFSFATVPQEKALTAKRSFSDVLFMDIPWDTKIDIWGGIKSFLNTQIRITF